MMDVAKPPPLFFYVNIGCFSLKIFSSTKDGVLKVSASALKKITGFLEI